MTSDAQRYVDQVHQLLRGTQVSVDGEVASLDEGCQRTVAELLRVRSDRRSVFVIGNGGSSAIATHMHNDLMKNVGVRSSVFHDVPLMTAITNDDGYARVFSDPLGQWIEAGDILISVSSSGRSENILRATNLALTSGARVLTLTGFDADNPLRVLGAVNFYVASHAYGLVESVHTVLTHLITDSASARLAEGP